VPHEPFIREFNPLLELISLYVFDVALLQVVQLGVLPLPRVDLAAVDVFQELQSRDHNVAGGRAHLVHDWVASTSDISDSLEFIESVERLPLRDKVVFQGNHIEVIKSVLIVDLSDPVFAHSKSLEDREIAEANNFIPRFDSVLL
jgi:hypothetical protein